MGLLYLVQAGLELREDVCHCVFSSRLFLVGLFVGVV